MCLFFPLLVYKMYCFKIIDKTSLYDNQGVLKYGTNFNSV